MTAPPPTRQRASAGPRSTRPRSAVVTAARLVLPVLFAVAMIAALGDLIVGHLRGTGAHAIRIAVPRVPGDPLSPPPQAAGQPVSPVPANRRIGTAITTMRQLQRALPVGTISRSASGWRLNHPIAVVGGGRLMLHGQHIDLAYGAFIEVRAAGRVSVSDSTITGLGVDGRPAVDPSPDRGFLLASQAGQLILANDRLTDLGRLASDATGLSFVAAAPGSALTGSYVSGSLIGVQIERSRGVRITDDLVARPMSDGISVRASTNVTIARNTIVSAGGPAIIVSDGARRLAVTANHVRCHAQYGIVLYTRVESASLVRNDIAGCVDGIALTNVARDLVDGNTISGATRYGIRLAGTRATTARANVFRRSLIGIYAYARSAFDRLLDNHFAANSLDLRVRQDTTAIVTSPIPADSVIGR